MDDIPWPVIESPQASWSLGRVSALRIMVREGRSRGEAALALGVTRAAVIGKCWRLGLSTARAKPFVSPKAADPRRKRIRVRIRKPWKPKPKPLQETAAMMPREPRPEPAGELAAAPCDFMALTSRTCRWPLWSDTLRVPFSGQFYCGAAVACDGLPYCGEHSHLSYTHGSGGARWR